MQNVLHVEEKDAPSLILQFCLHLFTEDYVQVGKHSNPKDVFFLQMDTILWIHGKWQNYYVIKLARDFQWIRENV